MTLDDLKKQGIFSTMTDQEIIVLCNSLNINANDMSFSVNDDMINRIIYSSTLNKFRIKSEVTQAHNSVISKYQELIDRYKNMLKDIESNINYRNETTSIKALITNLENEKASYEKEVNGFVFNNTDQYFKHSTGKIGKVIGDVSSDIARDNSNVDLQIEHELSSLYGSIDRIKQKNSKTLSNKIRDNIKLANLERKVNRLRKKQGRIHNSQQRIIVSNTNMYINGMDRKFERYFREQERINDAIENKKEDLSEIKALRREAQEEQNNIVRLEAQKLNSGVFGRISADIKENRARKNEERMKKRIERIKNKRGRINFTEQFKMELNRSFAR